MKILFLENGRVERKVRGKKEDVNRRGEKSWDLNLGNYNV